MRVVDIHPEELIDKLIAGELSDAERERLDAHLAQCSACRFEIGVRADLEQEAPLLEQRPQLTFAGQQAVQRAPLSGAGVEAERSAAQAPVSVRARSRRRWRLVLLAAALVLCAGGATAAVVSGAVAAPAWLPWSRPAKVADVSARTADAKLAHKLKRALPTAAPGPLNAAAPSLVPSSVDALAAPSVPPAPPSEPTRPVLAVRPAPVREALRQAQQPISDPALSSAAFPPVAAQPPAAESAGEPQAGAAVPHLEPAASLFADANRARRDGNVDRAVALYQSLQTQYPSSSESELSRALLAQLLLDRGSPEAALAGFDRYLTLDAPVLGAEALVGRARALEQLGKTADAAAAWRQVQSRFPGSVHARLAATRLAALGMR